MTYRGSRGAAASIVDRYLTGGRRSRRTGFAGVGRSLVYAVAVLVAVGLPAAAGGAPAGGMPRAADPGVPVLPTAVGTRCVPPSSAVVTAVPWAQRRLGLERAWELASGRDVVVAVLDTGVSAASPALAGAVLSGVDTVGAGGANTDCEGRGTFVAALIAGRPVPGVGFAGVAPQARILPVRVSAPGGVATAESLARGIRAAVDRGARVLAVSATTGTDSGVLRAAVAHAAAKDVVVVAAAQDRAGRVAPPRYPASYPGVVAVTGIGADGAPAEAAGVPPRVDVAAPGVNLVGGAPSGRGHYVASGSWAAVGFVAGVAALARDYRPKLTAVQVAHRLRVTADRPGRPLPDPLVGAGTVDPYAAVSAVLPEEAGASPREAVPVLPEMPRPRAADQRPRIAALAVAGVVAALVVAGVVVRGAVSRGRRRRWRPAR